MKIHPKTQALLKQKLLALIQNLTHSDLMTPMTIFTMWNISMKILTLLIHKKNTWKTMRLNKTNYIRRQIMT